MKTRQELIDMWNVCVQYENAVVEFLIKTGIVQVKEEKTLQDRINIALSKGCVTISEVKLELDRAGLKIVEK